jgi:uncharacterized membrane protein
MYGITLIPLISFISGYEKINWLSTLIILEFLLLAVVGYGLFNLNPDLTNNIGRVGLNARQSTLAFGDKSAFLMILSISIILSVKNIINRDKYKKILYLLGGIGIVLSTMGVAKAASRGPFIGAILGALFLFSKLKNRYKGICVLLASIIIVSLGINLQSLSNFAPVLFNRMVGTIETGDSSGRDVIFVEAWNKMLDEPLFGGSSVILYYDSFSGYHNAFLNMGVSLGLFAFFAYIYFFYKICVLILTYKYSYNLDTYFTFGMIAFYIVRSITGIGLVGDIEYCVILSMACIKLSTINNKIYYD